MEADEDRYYKLLTSTRTKDDVIGILEEHKNDADFPKMVTYFCMTQADVIGKLYTNYTREALSQDSQVDLYHRMIQYLPEGHPYYLALDSFYEGDFDKCLDYIRESLNKDRKSFKDTPMPLEDFIYAYVNTFKNAFPEFWDAVTQELQMINTEPGIREFCKIVPVIYESDDYYEIIQSLLNVQEITGHRSCTDELLGYEYYCDKKYENAIAYFERLDLEKEAPFFFTVFDIYFFMAWSYGSIKDYKNEIMYYQKSYEIAPEIQYTLNNLGYAYYKAKMYNRALEIFQKCLDEKADVKYAANNYVRTLLAMKRFKDAKAFVKGTSYKIYKSLLDRVNKASSTNKRISKDPELLSDDNETEDSDTELATEDADVTLGVSKQQFSAEHVLEDEIFSRIQAGKPTFGRMLKIYKRHGEFGRQYPLQGVGRLDLLAEDNLGELYVIELKKDSGYDDVYKQICSYLDWFDKNWKEKVPVHGIICLNNPSEKLIKEVHDDPRIQLYEYALSFAER
ncbi:MAG: hypothetical protein DUD27_07380 [Lachnospiraceae bacterium]|uniref:Uncharacterized protein n=1 Tax=Candidatus Weimeria bifida TaxID=2599074 RepID=A0A6N7IWQ6_9FIRM|nr:hypothetical protein [Candidatus Weimeria bifida]RRF95659.1 MAG: hypothetical protein DUD27_07380 [Lachnospiraceae bacterium]